MGQLFNRYLRVDLPDINLSFGGAWKFGQTVKIPHMIECSGEHRITQYPNEATITVKNITRDNQKRLTESDVESTPVELYSGYSPPGGAEDYGIMFKGKVRHVEIYIAGDGTTFEAKIHCGDGDDGYRWGNVNKTFPKGENDPKTIITHAVEKMTEMDSSIFLDILEMDKSDPEPRATTVHQSSKDVLNDISRTNDLIWQVQDGGVQVYQKKDVASPFTEYVLNNNSGLIGSPKITDVGVNIQCLCIHKLRPGKVVELESNTAQKSGVGIANGTYRIERIKFSLSLDASKPFSFDMACRRYEDETQRNKYRAGGQGG